MKKLAQTNSKLLGITGLDRRWLDRPWLGEVKNGRRLMLSVWRRAWATG